MPVEINEKAMCIGCGYSLRGLPDPVCPECGRAFDPADPRTFRMPSSRYDWATPPPRWLCIAVVALTAVAVNTSSTPGDPAPISLCNVLLLAVIGPWFLLFVVLDYLIRTVAVIRRRVRAARDLERSPGHRRWRWVVTPLCLALVASVWQFSWPMHLRFHLSRSAFEQAALSYLAGTKKNTGPQLIGLYYVEKVFSDTPGTVCFQTGTAFDPAGFAYRPNALARRNRIAPGWFVEEW